MTDQTLTESTGPEIITGSGPATPLATVVYRRVIGRLPVPIEWRRDGVFYPAHAQLVAVDLARVSRGEAPSGWQPVAVVIGGGNYPGRATRSGVLSMLTVATRYTRGRPLDRIVTERVPGLPPLRDTESWDALPEWAAQWAEQQAAAMDLRP